MNFLVTGIASDIGFNCGRILKEIGGGGTLHGADISSDHAGACLFDHCTVAPRASDPAYRGWLADYVSRHAIDYVIPTSEAEIAAIVEQAIHATIPARFVIANRTVVEKALDKHACLSFLGRQGLPVPPHGIVGEMEPDTWPVIVKPRSGQGSKGLAIFDDSGDYRLRAIPGDVWQQLLLPAEEEYTCPVYRSPAVGTRILVLRRTLQGGLTGKGEVIENGMISAYVQSIAEALDLQGAMNVQLRLTERGPLLFEINPRLSSTVMFRHKLGFRDLEWWLAELAGVAAPDYQPVPAGTRFYRGSQEYIAWP